MLPWQNAALLWGKCLTTLRTEDRDETLAEHQIGDIAPDIMPIDGHISICLYGLIQQVMQLREARSVGVHLVKRKVAKVTMCFKLECVKVPQVFGP
jgi:hypothetical protein